MVKVFTLVNAEMGKARGVLSELKKDRLGSVSLVWRVRLYGNS